MTISAPIHATEKSAAKLLDMSLTEFQKLVKDGHLPPGREIAPGMIRWPVDDLRRIASGDAIDGGIDW